MKLIGFIHESLVQHLNVGCSGFDRITRNFGILFPFSARPAADFASFKLHSCSEVMTDAKKIIVLVKFCENMSG